MRVGITQNFLPSEGETVVGSCFPPVKEVFAQTQNRTTKAGCEGA